MTALEAVIYATHNPGADCLMVAHNQESSDSLIRYAREWSTFLCRAPDAPAKITGKERTDRVRFTNGSVVKSIPGGNPAAIRSHGGSVWLDEFAYHRDQKENYRAAAGVLMQYEGVLRVISTPFSDIDEFWGIWENRDGEYSDEDWGKYRVTLLDAIADGLRTVKGNPIDIEELRKDLPDDAAFDAEYLCKALSDSESLFPRAQVDAAVQKFDPHFGSGYLYGGFDVAREGKDRSAIVEVRRDKDRYQCTRVRMAVRNVAFEAQQDFAVRCMEEDGWTRMAVDATGLGKETAERLVVRLGAMKVDPVTMTQQSKDSLMTELKTLFDQGKIALPNDRDLLLDLHSIKRIPMPGGGFRYDAERSARGHADRAIALALAVRAASTHIVTAPFTFATVPTGGGGREQF